MAWNQLQTLIDQLRRVRQQPTPQIVRPQPPAGTVPSPVPIIDPISLNPPTIPTLQQELQNLGQFIGISTPVVTKQYQRKTGMSVPEEVITLTNSSRVADARVTLRGAPGVVVNPPTVIIPRQGQVQVRLAFALGELDKLNAGKHAMQVIVDVSPETVYGNQAPQVVPYPEPYTSPSGGGFGGGGVRLPDRTGGGGGGRFQDEML